MNIVFIQIKLINSKRRYDAQIEHENIKEKEKFQEIP